MSKLHQQVKKQLGDLGKATAKVVEVDYSLLNDAFNFLAKPAKRALLNNGIHSPKDLARFTVETVAGFHGIGPVALDGLITVLKQQHLKFKNSD
jgi:hypothetical protein